VALRPEFRSFVRELFEGFGRVDVRPMFGAAGIFAGDVMFGLAAGERIYLKTDERSRKSFEDEGCAPFTFLKTATNGPIVTSYFEVPERLYDEPEELAEWAHRAHDVARASPTATRKRRKRESRTARQPAKR
jgi:DNA transformation protein